MAMRDSKRALAQVAALLGTDTTAARAYLRRVQHLAGPVPYDAIAEAMRQTPGYDAEQVAAKLSGDRTGAAVTDHHGAGAARQDG
jgi:hypothetical protein